MALYRTISLSFWTDTKVVDNFTPEDKYFYLYLLTNPHTNLCGCYEISKKQISVELGYSIDTINSLIERFEKKHNKIRHSEETNELLILNWNKYNWTNSPKFRKPLNKEIENVKDIKFKNYLKEVEKNGNGYGIDTYCIDTPVSVTVTNTDTNNNIIYDYITTNFGITINGTNLINIQEWLNIYNDEILCYAVDKCVEKGVRTLNYMNGILNNWEGCNYKTLQEIKEKNKKENKNIPEWFDKEIKKSEPTEQEKNNIQKLLKDYK